jgi:hypothetical protein
MAVLNQNQNQNQDQSIAVGVERRFRTRYNSDVESRLANVDAPDTLVPDVIPGAAHNYPDFHTYWDADWHACEHLNDFLQRIIGVASAAATTWIDQYAIAAGNGGVNIPPRDMNRAQLGAQVLQMLQLGLEREARFAEIIDQDDGPGAINYWLGMLKIDPARHPATYLMVHVGRRIGEHVAMCLKGHFMCPRPSEVSTWITPMIDPPVTPSYPAGHAIQSYLMSYLLAFTFTNDTTGASMLPQHQLPAIGGTANAFLANGRGALFDLATRVSQNRVVAGIHYPVDIRAGQAVAHRIFQDIRNVNSIWVDLRNAVRGEFPQYVRP